MGTVRIGREVDTWESRIRTNILYYPNKHSTNRTRDKSSQRFLYEEGGYKVSCTIDSWVVQVSPVADVCCVLATLVKRSLR